MTDEQTSAPCPLLFNYTDSVFGNGFVAQVEVLGRVLAKKEDGHVWMYGVQPGGLAAHGDTPDDAHEAFRATYREILIDIADSAADFSRFQADVHRFFDEVCLPVYQEWKAAVEEVRAGRVQASLTRKSADTEPFVRVTEKHEFSATDNEPRRQELAAA